MLALTLSHKCQIFLSVLDGDYFVKVLNDKKLFIFKNK